MKIKKMKQNIDSNTRKEKKNTYVSSLYPDSSSSTFQSAFKLMFVQVSDALLGADGGIMSYVATCRKYTETISTSLNHLSWCESTSGDS